MRLIPAHSHLVRARLDALERAEYARQSILTNSWFEGLSELERGWRCCRRLVRANRPVKAVWAHIGRRVRDSHGPVRVEGDWIEIRPRRELPRHLDAIHTRWTGQQEPKARIYHGPGVPA